MRNVVSAVGICASLAVTAGQARSWPPRDYLLHSLVNAVPKLLEKYHPETGKFGTEPWVYQDQMPIYPLAAAWSIEDPDNPYFRDPKLLAVIARGGEVWYEQQYDDGRWHLLRKNGDDWGKFRSSFVESHWIKTYHLVRDALPAESREKWETGLRRSCRRIPAMLRKAAVNNQPLRHAMALYIAGVCFDDAAWKDTASAYMAKVVAAQHPAGYWSEHGGPAVAYSMAYSWFLGIYYHFSQDPGVLDALQRASRFHLLIRWPNGSLIACMDERTIYTKSIPLGEVGFTFCPEGRALLRAQLGCKLPRQQDAPAEYCANMLLYSGKGAVAELPEASARTVAAIGDRDALIAHNAPWHWACSGYTCELSRNRWFQDRQNLVDVYHDRLGLVMGGGNTKLQPYWSTFTVGDPALLRFTPGNPPADLVPEIDLCWTPDSTMLSAAENAATHMDLDYAGVRCTVTAAVVKTGALRLTFTAPPGERVEAHLPFLRRQNRVQLGTGEEIVLTKKDLVLDAARTGRHFTLDRLRVSVPAGATLRWPAWQHNPYKRDGSSSISIAKLVLVLPFDTTGEYSVDLTCVSD
ncbi:MAG: hypothetical protein HN742_35930 [Lentisphaerae bacterium]|jgi:hypothetical protein|nr:hypothetical protein [Lentisphaerota bacterium]MBT4821187.1 hypothetical protein [Lentisphaerota bacterium]MBT5609785.1 hypothetical protein [Lentisphaerota bacterium]MBT7055070.1 hypothetical protein [Lentisphaerota bacterium]MBT7847315.1 hypothetical protein [Lentisphaerota bacterium]